MGLSFDGTNDNVSFGSDTSIDSFTARSVAAWTQNLNEGVGGVIASLVTKSDGSGITPLGWSLQHERVLDTGHLRFFQDWSLTDGAWVTANGSLTNGSLNVVAAVYDGGATSNNPTLYIDAASQAITETGTPTGSLGSDAAQNLQGAQSDSAGDEIAGKLGWIVYDDTLMTAADVNRHRWWGVAPGGPSTVSVWHPLWTNDLKNKGTATADGSLSGNTLWESIPRVERMWASCLGVGR